MVDASPPSSQLRHPLNGLLGSVGSVRVLRALVADRSPNSAPQLATTTGLTPQGTRLVLDALARQRFVRVLGTGRAQLYELNAGHPLAPAITALFLAEQARWDSLMASIRDILQRHGAAVHAGWLYGSVARGDDAWSSDLDIALIVDSPAVTDPLREDLMPLEDAQQVRVSLTALTPAELAALPEDDAWWVNVVRDARVLKGPAPAQARHRFAASVA